MGRKDLYFFSKVSQIGIWLFIALLPMHSHAQTSQHLLDSLMRVLKNHPKEDSVKVDIYTALSMATSSIDNYQCKGYLNEALRITQKFKNRDQEAGILIMIDSAQMERGESIKSIENFLPAVVHSLFIDLPVKLNLK